MSKIGIVYAKEVPMIKIKQVKEINGKGTPSANSDPVLDERWNTGCRRTS